MVNNPEHHFEMIKKAGGDSVTFHVEACEEPWKTIKRARDLGLGVGVAFKPETRSRMPSGPRSAPTSSLCMSIHPGYSGQEFMPDSLERIAALRSQLHELLFVQVDGGITEGNIREIRRAGAQTWPSRAARSSAGRIYPRAYRQLVKALPKPFERALELAERGRGTTHPNPVVGAVVVAGDEVVGEGWHERAGGPHAEVVALEAAGERARGATLYVTLEPCAALRAHAALRRRDRSPPGSPASSSAHRTPIRRRTAGASRACASRGVDVELLDGEPAAARAAPERGVADLDLAAGRPFVTYKAAVTLDGRVVVPESRWVTGEESRRRVHELRAASDAVAVGMGTVRADEPRLDARDVEAGAPAARLAFGSGPLPEGSELELVSGPLDEKLKRLAAEGVQSLLLEGGPTLATAFLREGLVDKLLLFVAPTLAGSGPRWVGELGAALPLARLEAERVGDDLLLTGYIHEP